MDSALSSLATKCTFLKRKKMPCEIPQVIKKRWLNLVMGRNLYIFRYNLPHYITAYGRRLHLENEQRLVSH